MHERREAEHPVIYIDPAPARPPFSAPLVPRYLPAHSAFAFPTSTLDLRLSTPPVTRHLYVHIPFCPKVCPYCSFYKEASDRNKTQPFLDAVLRELEMRCAEGCELQPHTIFFGGGTPSALTVRQMEYLLGGLRDRLDLSELVEWTLEMNPATVSLEKAQLLRQLGVNRVSLGVQAWDAPTLETLGRVHTADQARRSYALLREAGFDNINLDHIFGVPGQSREAWVDTLRQTLALRPDHISAYNLTYEEDTEFMRKFQSGEFTQDADADADLFEQTADLLAAAGFEPYETSNFAKPRRRCVHNLAYWRAQDYLGLGPSAFSTIGERRWSNVRDTAAYTQRILEGEFPADFHEPVSPALRRTESIAFGLRTSDGIERSWLQPWGERVEELTSLGLIATLDERVILTRRGRLLADSVAGEFI